MSDSWPGASVPAEVARRLVAARLRGSVLGTPLTDSGAFSLDDAYAVQREVTALRLGRGERVVGWKLGYTSLAMRAQMGIEGGDGAAERVPRGVVPGSALQPRVEPEIALRLARPLEPGCSPDDVLAACDGAFAVLEVVDSVWADYRFRLADNTADGSSAAWVVLGGAVPLDDLAGVAVRLLVDGEQAGDCPMGGPKATSADR